MTAIEHINNLYHCRVLSLFLYIDVGFFRIWHICYIRKNPTSIYKKKEPYSDKKQFSTWAGVWVFYSLPILLVVVVAAVLVVAGQADLGEDLVGLVLSSLHDVLEVYVGGLATEVA